MNPLILAINTSTIQFSAALLGKSGVTLAEFFISPSGGRLANLMPSVDALLDLSGNSIRDIKAVVTALGPGSFTGMRVGLSAGKGLAQSLNIPIIGVSSLEALAHQLPLNPFPLCTLIESRKTDIFTALFRWTQEGGVTRILEDTCVLWDDLPSLIREKTVFLGNDFPHQSKIVKKTLGDLALPASAHLWNLRASSVGAAGLLRYNRGEFDNLRDLLPSYLRLPDIRPNPIPLPSEAEMGVDK